MRYSNNQVIVVTLLASVAVVAILVRCFVTPAWGKEVVSDKSAVSDSLFVEVSDSVTTDTNVPRVRKECFSFELNGVTKEELMRFPGIAEGRAGAIVGYRERLGGYYSIDQLREINCMPDSLVDKMRKWVWVAEDSVRRLDVTKAKVRELKWHPYVTFEQAQRIDSARWVIVKRKQQFTVDSCKFAFDEAQWQKVKRYLR